MRPALALVLLASLFVPGARAGDPPPLEEALRAFAATADVDAAERALREAMRGAADAAGDEPPPELELALQRAELVIADAHLRLGERSHVERALEGYTAHIEVSSSPGLLFHAYVQRIEAELALRWHGEAAQHAEELAEVTRPYDPASKDELAALDALVLETCLRAHVLWTRALVALERPVDALKAAASIDGRRAAKGWEAHPLAPLLAIERARALCAVGRGLEAAASLEALASRGRAALEAEHLAGIGMSRDGALACRALADLDLDGALPLDDPAVAHDVGLGHLIAGRPGSALVAWKRVLTVARTKEARERWVPDAAERAGKLLAAQERWLEAALLLTAALELAPGDPAGARLGLQCATRAVYQHGEELTSDGPVARLCRRLQAQAPDGPSLLPIAAEHERASRWSEAATAYLETPTAAPERASSLLRAARCLLQLHHAGTAGALERAREALVEAHRRGAEAQRAQAGCLRAEVELEAGRPGDALDALRRVAPWPDAVKVWAGRQSARAHLALGRREQAVAAFREVATRRDDPHHAPFAIELAGGLRDAAQALPLAQARELHAQAATCVTAWATDPDALTPAHALWAARALFDAGRVADAAPLYRSALARLPEPDDERTRRSRVRLEAELAWCLAFGEDARAGFDALAALRDAVTVRDAKGRVVARGTLVERLATGPFRKLVEGRETQVHAFRTVVRTSDGRLRTFVDRAAPSRDDRFEVIEGLDPTRPWLPDEARTLALEERRDALVVLGLERAMWARWTKEGDPAFLAREALPACGAALVLLRGLDAKRWLEVATSLPDEPEDLTLRRWDAELRVLEVKLALERWGEAASDVRLMKLLRDPLQVPDACEPRWAAILRTLEARR